MNGQPSVTQVTPAAATCIQQQLLFQPARDIFRHKLRRQIKQASGSASSRTQCQDIHLLHPHKRLNRTNIEGSNEVM
jgi:hypothetical protein